MSLDMKFCGIRGCVSTLIFAPDEKGCRRIRQTQQTQNSMVAPTITAITTSFVLEVDVIGLSPTQAFKSAIALSTGTHSHLP